MAFASSPYSSLFYCCSSSSSPSSSSISIAYSSTTSSSCIAHAPYPFKAKVSAARRSSPLYNSSILQCGNSAASFGFGIVALGVESSLGVAACTAGDDGSSAAMEGKLQFSIQEACCSSQLYAAAALRARTFYNYPEERSMEARESHQKYMTAVEWRALQSKVSGTEMGFGRVACLIAICSIKDLPMSSTGLLEVITLSGEPMFVIGTLDINQGRVLPGEIQGLRPQGSDADHCRGYLSNFCVAEETRRKGVGMALIREAQKRAKAWGTSFCLFLVCLLLPSSYLNPKA
ncbi:hypothetical protein O6H91_Y026400 [Diphasiastrum complanatum]|nr:hypothetical protein O6H91_Y421600 [Diphasiastrum complanatum]KAJ7300265.1 hypothetical protein O6H91_Y026400 [Diphasiastrum complanatum]